MRNDCNFQVASASQDSWPRFEERLSTVCPEGNPGECSPPHIGRRKVSGFTRLLLVMARGCPDTQWLAMTGESFLHAPHKEAQILDKVTGDPFLDGVNIPETVRSLEVPRG